ncbi:MAG: translocation/assembly module TamB domain-containing protein, partial [Candidatus Sericytochromatia bacterium]|nr:translocation/assembly module TamB domain-containing protein [Candidatus Sericytochromatia bacterium]
IQGKILSSDFRLSELSKFVDLKNIKIKDGTTKLNVNFDGNLNKITKNTFDFNAKGDVGLNNLKTTYINEGKDAPIKTANGTTEKVTDIQKTINQDLQILKVNFDWKSGLLDIPDILLKNGRSSISGNGNLDINKFKKNPDLAFGKLTLNSDSFDFKDFPIKELASIKDGELKKLNLTAQISKNVHNLAVNLNTDVRNLSFENQSKIDTILANIDLKNSLLNIKKLSLDKDKNYLNANGTVNILNMSNPKFDLILNSRNFPIKSIFSLVPESILKKATSKNGSLNAKDKKIVKVSYKLPVKNNFVIKNETISVNKLIEYWEKWSLEPLTEKDKVNSSATIPPFWKAIDGEMSVNAKIKGDMLEPKANIDLIISNAEIYSRKINEIFVKASYDNGEIDIPNFHFLENEGGYLVLSGNLSDTGKVKVDAQGKLNLNWAKTFMGDKSVDVEGNTAIILGITGTSTNPDIQLSVDAEKGGVFNNVHFDDLSLIGSYKDKIVTLNDARITSGGKEAKASGIIPLDESLGSMNVSLGLTGESLGLINLFTNEIEWLRGQGDAFINVQGTINDPLINGRLNIENGEIYVASLGKPLEKINVNVGLSNHFVKINKADAFLNDGKVSMLGQVDLIGFKPGFLKLKLFADDFRYEESNINIRAKVGLTINNTINEPLIGGKVQLTKGEYNLAIGNGKSGSATAKSKKKVKSPVAVKYNNLKIEIPKETDFWVRSAFFDLRPYGNLNLQKGAITDPTILGLVTIDKGSLYLINNEFKIVDATADFGGKDFERDIFPINPHLSITADTKLINPRSRANVDVEAKITGDLSDIPDNKVQISWTKNGGLTDSEIWTQVVGLNAAQQLVQDTGNGSAATIAKFATPYFNRAIFNPLTSKVADFLNLDEFNVGIAADAISNPGVTLAISKPILGGLSIGYEGTIRSSNSAQYNFFSRYRFNNNLSARLSVDERNAGALQGEYGFSF